MRRSAQRSNQWCVPCGTRIRSPAPDFDGEHRFAGRMHVKHAATLDDEPHLVFVVPVLGVEAIEHRVETRRVGKHVDDVGGHVAALRVQLVDLLFVGREQDSSAGASAATGTSGSARQ